MPVRASAMALPPAFPVCAIVPSNRAWVGPAAAGAPEAPRHRRMAPRTISSTDSVQVPCEQLGFRVAVTRVGSTGLAPRLGATLMTACHAEDEYCQGTSLTRPRDSCFIFIRQDSGNSCRGSKQPIFFSMLWQYANRRPIPGLRLGSGRMQTADHDCPFMTLSSEFGAPPAFHRTQVLHRSTTQLTNHGTPSRPVRWRSP